jgi:AraC family transcriptional regulator of adaptative response/methylated-DNA-[protein]-cysteine methyltransferase
MTPREKKVFDMGTEFQKKVWEELLKIPVGSVVTYEYIAKCIGRPTAVRAVANAIGANNLPVTVPCHRVVRKDGGLGGYKWGVEKKKKLLKKEGYMLKS